MRAPDAVPAELAERHSSGTRSIFLERAEYVSSDYRRRLVVDFDWPRAAANLPPWRLRRYLAKPHATSPNGIAWRLAARGRYYASLPAAHKDARPWMTSARDTP